MKVIAALAAIALGAMTTAAYAQTFTSAVEVVPNSNIVVGATPPDAEHFFGRLNKSALTMTYASGRKVAGTGTCIAMSQPPRDSIFNYHRICDVVLADGAYTSISGCNFTSKSGTENACVGELIGTSGAYAGRHGVYNTHAVGTKTIQTGQWFDK